jgi:putative transposase
METPFYGVLRTTAVLRAQGYAVNRKRVHRLMRQLGIQAVMLRKRPVTSTPGHRVYPYLLRVHGRKEHVFGMWRIRRMREPGEVTA